MPEAKMFAIVDADNEVVCWEFSKDGTVPSIQPGAGESLVSWVVNVEAVGAKE